MRLRFDRFSRYHAAPSAFGLDLRPAALYPFVYPLQEEDLEEIACFFEDENRRRHPNFADLLDRPGIRVLTKTAALWGKRFHSPVPPSLTMRMECNEPVISDSRTSTEEYRPDGIEWEILLACVEGISRGELFTRLDHPTHRIEAAFRELVDRKLLMLIRDDCISLPLQEPVPELPGRSEYPGGCQMDSSNP
jgi:hypothetical protein